MIPASIQQQGVWFHSAVGGAAYWNFTQKRAYKGLLRAEELRNALGEVIAGNAALRTGFLLREGILSQVVHPSTRLDDIFRYVRMQDEDDARRLDIVREESMREEAQVFDLENGPLMRFKVLDFGDVHFFILTIHHIATDVTSMDVFWNQLALCYNRALSGDMRPPPASDERYLEYASAQHTLTETPEWQRQRQYWMDRMSGRWPVLDLSLYGKTAQPRMCHSETELPAGLAEAVRTLSLKKKVLYSSVFLTAYFLFLYKYSRQGRLAIGNVVNGRGFGKKQYRDVIGLFAKRLVHIQDITDEDTVGGLLEKVNADMMGGFRNSDFPYEEVVRALNQRDRTGLVPLCQAVFNMIKTGTGDTGFRDLSIYPGIMLENAQVGNAQFDIGLSVTDDGRSVRVRLDLKCDEAFQPLAGLFLQGYCKVLEACVLQPPDRVGAIDPIPASEYRLLDAFGHSVVDYPRSLSVLQLFETRSEKAGDDVALICGTDKLTYRELDRRAARVGDDLHARGIGRGDLVGVCVQRSLDMVVGLLGIWKAGAAFVPIHPEYPVEHLRYMIEDIDCRVCLSNPALREKMSPQAEKVEWLDIRQDRPPVQAKQGTPEPPHPEDLAYVIYTSGSTGKPKGVMIQHRALADHLVGMIHSARLDDCHSFGLIASLVADAGYSILFASMAIGGVVHILPEALVTDGQAMSDYLNAHAIDCIKIVPSLWMSYVAAGEAPLPRKVLIFGGEALPPPILDHVFRAGYTGTVYNHYGPTEATIGKTICRIEPGKQYHTVPIGSPFSNTRIVIVDPDDLQCPIGIAGEIWLGGEGVAQGYLHKPELTTEKFVADPFGFEEGLRFYKTGDLGRWLPEGNIEYLGRLDDQVKIRGYRIEPGEIESAIRRSGLVRQTVVMAREDPNGQPRLVAYVVPGTGYDRGEMTDYLRTRLPEHMIPALWMTMDAIPLTVHGKADKRALPEPAAGAADHSSYEAPRDGLEQDLSQTWSRLLGMDRIGINDSFFALGGHSLLAAQLIAAIRRRWHLELSIREIFSHPTIAGLSTLLRQREVGAEVDWAAIVRERQQMDRVPLSFNQERLWFIDQLEGSRHYHIPWVIRLKGLPDEALLERSFRAVIHRHQILRTVLLEEEGKGYQAVQDGSRWRMDRLKGEKQLEEWMDRPFDLSADFMLRAALVDNQGDYLLAVVVHHIASDGWSWPILLHELSTVYRGGHLEELKVQYADYALWQRKYFPAAQMETDLAYWKQQLKGLEPLRLLGDRGDRTGEEKTGAAVQGLLGQEEADALRQLSKKEGVTLFMLLLSVWKLLLYRYSGQQDICVGTPVSGRTMEETQGMIGFFVHTLPLRTGVDGAESFLHLLSRVRDTVLEGFQHQQVPFEKEVGGQGSLFEVLFMLQPKEGVGTFSLGEEQAANIALGEGRLKYDLTMMVWEEEGGGLGIRIPYNTTIYEKEEMLRMVGHYSALLQSVARQPEGLVGRLKMLQEAEEKILLEEFNAGGEGYKDSRTVVDLFREQAAERGSSAAVVCGSAAVSYEELDARSEVLSRCLGGEALVGICMERSVEMIVGLLGVLKAGGAYVPLDPEYPPERLQYMLEDTAARVVLVDDAGRKVLEGWYGGRMLEVTAAPEPHQDGPVSPAAGDLAYVIYTSGSTGRPKGVMIGHRGLVNVCLAQADFFRLEPGMKTLQFASFGFDASCSEIFATLVTGGCLVLPDKEDIGRIDRLGALIDRQHIRVMTLPPSYQQLAKEVLPSFCTVISAGEPLNRETGQYLQSKGIRLLNAYGPTENTICATMTDEPIREDGTIVIGPPMAGVRIYLLDRQGRPVPQGAPGEIYLSGTGVAKGYLNRPELTAERFLPDPFSREENRMFRTGDLGRWLPDGNIEYLGRLDEQVKIRGYRIEPGEIESLALQSGFVEQCVVTARKDHQGNSRLVGYVVEGEGFDRTRLLTMLNGKLPAYMVPGIWVSLEAIPTTVNGKVDKAALPEPDAAGLLTETYFAPRNAVEQALAAICQDLLGIERIGIRDNFFTLGGDSIITIQVTSRARRLGYDLLPKDIFQYQDIERLAAALAARSGLAAGTRRKEPLQGNCGLFPIQQWYLAKEEDNRQVSHFNQSLLLDIDRAITAEDLSWVLKELTTHHDALRCRFIRTASGWTQVYGDVTPALSVCDLSGIGDQPEQALAEKAASFQETLDITRGDLVHMVLFLMPAGNNRLLLVIHHLVVDGVSWRILTEDLERLLTARREEAPVVWDADGSSCRDWYEALERYGTSPGRQQSYWEEWSAPRAPLPVDLEQHPQLEVRARDWKTVVLRLPGASTRQLLQETSAAYHTEINDVLLAALARTLCAWTGYESISIGLEGHGREESIATGIDLGRTVGWFTTTYPVLLRTATAWADLIRETKENLRRIPDKGLGYGVLRYIQKTEGLQGPQPWEMLFNYLGKMDREVRKGKWFRAAAESTGPSMGTEHKMQTKISLNCWVAADELHLSWGYSGLHYREDTIRKLGGPVYRSSEGTDDALHQAADTFAGPDAFRLRPG
jgi:amino acid adenylation domain-containing protein/non-ribosomal peptide synthase protein (TIGR01720 family)